MRHAFKLGAAFAIGVAVVGVIYALVSVYALGIFERMFGRGGTVQVIVTMAVMVAVLSGVAFGWTVRPLPGVEPRSSLIAAAVLGALVAVTSGFIHELFNPTKSLILATATFVIGAVCAGVVYRFVVARRAAS